MKVVFHDRFYQEYTSDPAAARGRMESMVQALAGRYDFVAPEPATEADLERVHGQAHIRQIRKDAPLYDIARLAAGGAMLAAEIAVDGEPAFGLVRPPGHHASPDSCWGFCHFNNVAVAVRKLIAERKIGRALVLDFDLHYGDGTANVFAGSGEAVYFHPEAATRPAFLEEVERALRCPTPYDIVAVSAGFDRHEKDWGDLLATEDYFAIGRQVREHAHRRCRGRRFGVLEGGYNHAVLGQNVRRFLEGLGD